MWGRCRQVAKEYKGDYGDGAAKVLYGRCDAAAAILRMWADGHCWRLQVAVYILFGVGRRGLFHILFKSDEERIDVA
eukprot:764783-Hanusia_phi.AAC.2